MSSVAIITGLICAIVGFIVGVLFCRDLDREKAKDLNAARAEIIILRGQLRDAENRR